MKKEKVLIVYENVVREYDNALLLKAELVKRGFEVEIVYKMDLLWKRRNNIVLVLPNGYNDADIDAYKFFTNTRNSQLISLQYEQVFSKRMEATQIHIPKGKAAEINLFCWGKHCYNKLLNAGIKKERLCICGAMHLDFLRDEFRDFYLSKEDVAERYHLDLNKKWFLYVSSFTHVNNPNLMQYAVKDTKYDFINDFTAVSIESQKKTLEWFDKLLQDNEDLIVIYRKHPVEFGNASIQQLLEKYPERFRDIGELAMKQWIKVADITATWVSTSAAEMHVAKKSVLVIRPCVIDENLDMPIYQGVESIDSYEKLQAKVKEGKKSNCATFNESVLYNYYDVDKIPAYIKVADEIERLAEVPVCGKEKWFGLRRWMYLFRTGILFKFMFKKVYQFFFRTFGFKIKSKKFRDKYCVAEWEKMAKHYNDKINEVKYKKLGEVVMGNENK